jgi:hypothetical protein
MRQIVVSSAVSGLPDRAIFAGSSFEIVTEEAIDSACRCRFHAGNRRRGRHVTLMFCDLVDSTGIPLSLMIRLKPQASSRA